MFFFSFWKRGVMDNFFGWTKSSANSLHSGKLTFSSGKATISVYCHSNLLGEHWRIHNFDGILLGNMVIFHAWLVYRSVASLFIYDPQIYGLLVRNPCRFLFFLPHFWRSSPINFGYWNAMYSELTKINSVELWTDPNSRRSLPSYCQSKHVLMLKQV